jgi:hypothetical protein
MHPVQNIQTEAGGPLPRDHRPQERTEFLEQ